MLNGGKRGARIFPAVLALWELGLRLRRAGALHYSDSRNYRGIRRIEHTNMAAKKHKSRKRPVFEFFAPGGYQFVAHPTAS
jgi:hypothetical protein